MSETAEPPRYVFPPERVRERQALRDEWTKERAQRGHELIAALPPELQPAAFELWMILEQLHGQHSHELRVRWMLECEHAYLTGRADQLKQSERDMDPTLDDDAYPVVSTRTH